MAKPRGEKGIRPFKNFVKNQHVFMVLFDQEDFRRRLVRIATKYFPTDDSEKKFSRISAEISWRFDNRSELRKISMDMVKTMQFEAQFNLNGAVNKFLKDYHLGSEWLSTVYDFVILGYILPPVYNFAMSQDVILPTAEEWASRGKKEGWTRKARATLILNPDTTLDDIKDAWPVIKKHQKSSWPSYRSYKFSPKTIVRDFNVQKIDRTKKEVSDEEKYAGLRTEMEQVLAKKYRNDRKTMRIEILKLRRRSGNKSQKIKIKRKLTDMDIVRKQGLKGAAAKKAHASLRQQRHRRKNVTPFLL